LYSGQQWDFGSLVVHISIVVKEGGNSTIGIYYSQDRVEVNRSNQWNERGNPTVGDNLTSAMESRFSGGQ